MSYRKIYIGLYVLTSPCLSKLSTCSLTSRSFYVSFYTYLSISLSPFLLRPRLVPCCVSEMVKGLCVGSGVFFYLSFYIFLYFCICFFSSVDFLLLSLSQSTG
ncbi:hypothetical protein CSUI_006375 [Cystoisospora suis]|uniref:Transmembrane protein n=1 Tax=Cystoisospora suis TaxID=483139 RepID=A0A2C6KH26_9APIC|nr:hypothetical protein CSUI_006375 [Cystoisospora suis]